jgi:hypothetical protein
MSREAGKGDSLRPTDLGKFGRKWESINWGNKTVNNQSYIDERMQSFAMDIDNYSIGQTVLDTDKVECEIVDKTANSIQVSIRKKGKDGIDVTQWFGMNDFKRRFK